MKLYYSDASPYARMVRVMIELLQLNHIQLTSTNPFDNDEEFVEANPLGKVPCLMLADGSALYDSEVICRFLDVEYGQSQLFAPADGYWSRHCLFSMLKGMLDSAVALRQEQMRAEEGNSSPFWKGRFEQALLRGLRQIDHSGLLNGDEITAERIALVCLLDYLDFRHPSIEWRNLAPATALWLNHISKESIFRETRPA
ncbi:glutathione S-transferase N-terminal domain-containing protein [Shewanella corallii]|uniref:Glutathione S-transferase N-terminal domain-containing protein n=1 Tax=Shewanella corallii TaxID=560080 RepID=A0ABT0N5C3_9GAMM|nr:glutathione S-transferase N-terminal domain-containing protein [Shewanella corallii]MCL2913609.1 glutathione S-transferase N-terminal domain-containing protein [Shewanella corallii]